jgi:UDP-N-acetylmuramoyl-L-alanyl-D-glutamate--2,6-diaminopimelate ligase
MTTLAELFTECGKYPELKMRLAGDCAGVSVTSIAYDSRAVKAGSLFVALRGQHSDGHNYVAAAVEKGASAVMVDDRFVSTGAKVHVPCLTVENTRSALPFLASAFYGHPSEKFDLIGVTGTNGKTTTTYMIAGILHAAGYKTAVVGTVGVYVDGEPVETHWGVSTTPESVDLQALFADFLDRGVQKVVMEVTSIAVDQERTACCAFDTAVFTNFTQDHLDYHGTMEQYRACKERLFVEYAHRYAKPGFNAVINIDDETGRWFADELGKDSRTVVTYGVRSQNADLLAEAIDALPNGTRFHAYERRPRQRAYSIALSIGGLFNVYNGLAAIAAARLRDIDPAVVQQGLATMLSVPGRFEPVRTGDRGFHVLVDYAHTSDGLDNVLRSALALKPTRVIAVFGCGGNRDTGKRPLMGKIAVELADRVIVTSDNPRREQPDAIIADILAGIDGGAKHPKVVVEPDRRAAIRVALCREARPGDIVVIAGKGHETYQLVGDQAFPFDDRTVAAEVLAECE